MTFHSALPGRVLVLVARGDRGMFERMARLFEPGRKQAAILFADLQMSGALSRRLPSAAFFKLMRTITSAIDDVVIARQGIVGKHAGDGVTAFFLADDLGSSSAAAATAIEAARDISVAARDGAKAVAEETGLFDSSECMVNVGVHWGGHLYMGQLVTEGRLEITALGDEVNECARIQQTAEDGQVLASKSLIEHLSDEDAEAVGLDPDGVLYRALAELPGSDEKAVRDAGSIPVTTL
jgi:class 3 adenylate cyclase